MVPAHMANNRIYEAASGYRNILAYLIIPLASIVTGQLRHCVISNQQGSRLSKPRFLELGGGRLNTLRAPPPRQKVGRTQVPLAPRPGFCATA